MNSLFSKRFAELIAQSEELEKTKRTVVDSLTGNPEFQIDHNRFVGWKVKVKSLLERACGPDSQHVKAFEEKEKGWGGNSFDRLQTMRAILAAAQEDHDGGYLRDVKTIAQAEIFDSELDQAEELLKNGFRLPAAVVAGTVLETNLRGQCDKRGIAIGKLNKMNDDLYKAGAYTILIQKKVIAMAQIRNDAAHGNHAAFQAADVSSMIQDVRKFVTDNQ